MLHTTSVVSRQYARRGVMACFLVLTLVFLVALPAWSASEEKDQQTLKDSAQVLEEMLNGNSIPPDLISKAECVIVMPNVKKFSVGIGGTGGRGPMTCRKGKNFKGSWSAPAMYTIGGASAGLQLGGSSTDFVLLVMDERGLDAILKGKTQLGKDATAAAGPGATEKQLGAGNDILTYAKSSGVYAGVSLGGATIEEDKDANKRLYGKDVAAADILRQNAVQTTDAGKPLISLLDSKVSARR
ncbi:MAG TPA: lipid-binding SYLF domain-containing protein [Terriglobales bacterium]|nr:lipid-binding SYLF domain-containing protein [Terriglobales bacterium]